MDIPPPRFPQPAIETLLEYADWRDVLNALSVDQREAPARCWLINATGMFTFDDTGNNKDVSQLRVFEGLIEKYSGSVRAMRRGKILPWWIPPNLQRMKLEDCSPRRWRLPESLTHLSTSVGTSSPPAGFAFPPALRHLTLHNWSNDVVPSLLESSVTHLEIGTQRLHRPRGQCLPRSLKHLTIYGNIFYAQFLQCVQWPEGLQSLYLPNSTLLSLHGVAWPTTLTNLHIGGVYDVHLPEGSLPPTLTHLTVSCEEIQVLGDIAWPKTITHLRAMETDWRNNLPPTLRVLVITSNSLRREDTTRGLDRVVWPATLRHLTVPHRLPSDTPRPPEGCVVVIDRHPKLLW